MLAKAKDLFISEQEGCTFVLKPLNKIAVVFTRVARIFMVTCVSYITLVGLLYKHYDCEGWSYALFGLLNLFSFVYFALKQQYFQIQLYLLSALSSMILMANLITDQNKKTICDVTICHSSSILQENIDVIIQSLRRQRDFCDRMSDEQEGKEQTIEEQYLDTINMIWTILCRFYDQISGGLRDGEIDEDRRSDRNSNHSYCRTSVTADKVFLNNELKFLKLFFALIIFLVIILLAELILEQIFKNKQGAQEDLFLTEEQTGKTNVNPLMEFYRQSTSSAGSNQYKHTAQFPPQQEIFVIDHPTNISDQSRSRNIGLMKENQSDAWILDNR